MVQVDIDKDKIVKFSKAKFDIPCEECILNDKCQNLPDPLAVDKQTRSFLDFCCELDKTTAPDLVPEEESIIKLFEDLLPIDDITNKEDKDLAKILEWIKLAKLLDEEKSQIIYGLEEKSGNFEPILIENEHKIKITRKIRDGLRQLGIITLVIHHGKKRVVAFSWSK